MRSILSKTPHPAVFAHMTTSAERCTPLYFGRDEGDRPPVTYHPSDSVRLPIQFDVLGVVPLDRLSTTMGTDGSGVDFAYECSIPCPSFEAGRSGTRIHGVNFSICCLWPRHAMTSTAGRSQNTQSARHHSASTHVFGPV
jgi:hypothetical protein